MLRWRRPGHDLYQIVRTEAQIGDRIEVSGAKYGLEIVNSPKPKEAYCRVHHVDTVQLSPKRDHSYANIIVGIFTKGRSCRSGGSSGRCSGRGSHNRMFLYVGSSGVGVFALIDYRPGPIAPFPAMARWRYSNRRCVAGDE